MARYELRIKASVARDLRAVPREDVRRILTRVESLREDPRSAGSEKLSGQERYRLRQGDYRIVDAVDDASAVIEVVKVGHRRDVYRDW